MEQIVLIVAIVLAVAFCLVVWYVFRVKKAGLEREISVAYSQAEQTRADCERRVVEIKLESDRRVNEAKREASEQIATLKEENREQLQREEEARREQFAAQLQLAREEMRSQFEKEMVERTHNLKEANREQMAQVVGPLQEELKRLHQLVDTSRSEQNKNTSVLETSIKAVIEHDRERDKTTQSLADALKNRGKVQGDWGEQVLENILRDSGLREGEEYEKQYNVKTEEGGNDRPDVVVKGADGSRIIIDSKVSLTAYTNYVGAETDEERRQAIRENHASIWSHVLELADKKYHREVDKAMPIVLMFVPNEGSYILAMNHDPQLGTKAYKKGILIINPTNLMVVLRLMFVTWQNTRQEKNNREILESAAKIYEKYSTFAEGYVTMGNQLNTLRNTYERGMGQLKEGPGNLSKRLQDLLRYGVSPTKQIPEQIRSIDVE